MFCVVIIINLFYIALFPRSIYNYKQLYIYAQNNSYIDL